jgi:carbon storage regulator
MLVLSRKISECILTSNGIRIMVVDIRGDKVRIGIDAPSSVAIHRAEVWDVIVNQGMKVTSHAHELDFDHPAGKSDSAPETETECPTDPQVRDSDARQAG